MVNSDKRKNRHIITPTRVLVLGFALIIAIGAFLLCLPISNQEGVWFPFSKALFTSTSAVCVTGLTVVDTAATFSAFGQAVILLLIQIGGLGVMTAATLLFMMVKKRITLKSRMVMQEALSENRLQGLVKSIRTILIMTFVIELIGALILMGSFIPRYGAYGVWVSVFTSVSAFCNAGFDILGVVESEYCSLMPFVGDAFVCLPIMALIVVGGIGFMVMSDVGNFMFKKKHMSANTKIVLISTLCLILVGWATFLGSEWNGLLKDYDTGTKILAALFQSISPRTAGFYTIDQGSLNPISYISTVLLMLVGASPSSTGGGIKTTTMVILFLTAFRTLQGKKDVVLNRSKVNSMTIRKAVTLTLFACLIISCNSFIIMAIETNIGGVAGLDQVIYEVTSAFSTVGLSMGITAGLSVASQMILCLTMFIGRVGALTIGFSLVKGNKDFDSKVEYTDARILIG